MTPRRVPQPITTEELEAATERLARAVMAEAPDQYVACELCCRLLSLTVSRCLGQPALTARLDPDAWLTTRQAATALGVSPRYLNKLLHEGRIASAVIGMAGKHRRVKGADLLRYLDERRAQTPGGGDG